MSENTKIEWCDHTVNLWRGCDKVSPGCANCYAAAMDRRFYGGLNWKGMRTDKRGSGTDLAMRLNRKAGKLGIRYRVFNGSMNDWLDDKVPEEWLAELLALIHATPHLDWLLLSKRPENWKPRIEDALNIVSEKPNVFTRYTAANLEWWNLRCWLDNSPPANVWIGTTAENQEMADKRIPQLLRIPAKVRFLSCEPLLGPVDIVSAGALGCDCPDQEQPDGTVEARCSGRCAFYRHAIDKMKRIDWVICGGESGPKARPMHPFWARSLRDQCEATGVPFFFKQWGEWLPQRQFADAVANIDPDDWNHMPRHIFPQTYGVASHRCGKKRAGRLLDGCEHNEFPTP